MNAELVGDHVRTGSRGRQLDPALGGVCLVDFESGRVVHLLHDVARGFADPHGLRGRAKAMTDADPPGMDAEDMSRCGRVTDGRLRAAADARLDERALVA